MARSRDFRMMTPFASSSASRGYHSDDDNLAIVPRSASLSSHESNDSCTAEVAGGEFFDEDNFESNSLSMKMSDLFSNKYLTGIKPYCHISLKHLWICDEVTCPDSSSDTQRI